MPIMSSKTFLLFASILTICFVSVTYAETDTEKQENADAGDGGVELDYTKGSVCGYCQYCEFCSLCDKSCPCETSPSKPNCHMCKYCKYCYVCSSVCDTICQPGGILDKVSGAIVNSLPFQDKDEIDEDLKGIKGWMDANKKDEL